MHESAHEDLICVLQEACNQIKDFNNIWFKTTESLAEYFKNREATKKKLKISFSSLDEIEKLKQKDEFKLAIWNQLGVKCEEDWILNLNIGNVMSMNILNFDEINNQLVADNFFRLAKQ